MRMKGKSGVVTGAASGLGREIALLFAAEGANVVIADVNETGAAAIMDEITSGDGTAVAVRCDVTKEADIQAAIASTIERFGRLDFMINNAGVLLEGRLHEVTNEQYDWQFDINCRGVFWGCKHAVLAMKDTGGGTIVNTASGAAFIADPFGPVYTATKHAVLGFTRSIGVSYADVGIRCNCVCPGDMDTPMLQKAFELTNDPANARVAIEAHYPAKRMGHPSEVAKAVLFMASDESSYMNGSFMLVDGGLLAQLY
jgi:NAD(P)-dependent dehydrogenase (short-subunit alcohol dehydrogenase family)